MPSTTSNAAAIPMQGGRGRRPTARCRAPIATAPLGADDLDAARDRRPTWSAARTSGRACSSARITLHLEDGDAAARRALRVLALPQPRRCAARRPARPAGSAARSGCSNASGGDCVGARLLLIPVAASAASSPATRGRARDCGRGRDDRRALRRRRPARPRRARAGQRADQVGARRRGPRAARRGDGRGHGGRAVADGHRPRLLQRDRGLPGGLRPAAAPRSGPAR